MNAQDIPFETFRRQRQAEHEARAQALHEQAVALFNPAGPALAREVLEGLVAQVLHYEHQDWVNWHELDVPRRVMTDEEKARDAEQRLEAFAQGVARRWQHNRGAFGTREVLTLLLHPQS